MLLPEKSSLSTVFLSGSVEDTKIIDRLSTATAISNICLTLKLIKAVSERARQVCPMSLLLTMLLAVALIQRSDRGLLLQAHNRNSTDWIYALSGLNASSRRCLDICSLNDSRAKSRLIDGFWEMEYDGFVRRLFRDDYAFSERFASNTSYCSLALGWSHLGAISAKVPLLAARAQHSPQASASKQNNKIYYYYSSD